MKKSLMLVISIICFSLLNVAFAASTANIRIHISGAASDNRYFLCIPNIGCLSILDADNGKVYPIYHAINMHPLYVTNLTTMRLNGLGLPNSCNVTVNPGQTININGHLAQGPNNSSYISNLHCSLS